MDKIVPIFPIVINSVCPVYNSITSVIEMPDKCCELNDLLQLMENSESDMYAQLKKDKASNPCMKQKASVGTFFELVRGFKEKASKTLEDFRGGNIYNHIVMRSGLDNCLKEGKELLDKANLLMKEGLTRREVYTRGMRLPVVELIGNTAKELREEALRSIRRRTRIIGIHGNIGSGKTNFMKFLHNDVHADTEHYKAVFWAGAPQEQQPDIKSLQDCIAEAIQFKFEDEDVVRRSGLLASKLKHIVSESGHVVLFLDDLKEHFSPYDVGIPIIRNEAEKFCCTLVFTTRSESVCNKMRCSKFKMNLLPEDEARELFFHEAGWNTCVSRSYGRRIEKVAGDVVKQCSRMPHVITLIARSMTGKEDICEWNTRLNQLKGILDETCGEEAKILEQLKFSFNSIQDSVVRDCFLDSASVLLEGHQLTKKKLIQHWIQKGIISRKRHRGANITNSAIDDQGHTVINILQRAYLLEVVELDGTEYVSMNKWIRKMAGSIPPEEGHFGHTIQLSQCKTRRV